MSTGDWLKPPNLISLFRGCIGVLLAGLGIFGGIFLALDYSPPPLPLVWLQVAIVLGVISDKVDGVLARHFRWETALGKILERNMDGFFICSAVLFETVYLGFPKFLLVFAAAILSIGATVICLSRLLLGQWFKDEYISNKIGPGFAYLLLILHTFHFSYVLWFDFFAVLVGIFVLVDFLRRYYLWLQKITRQN